MNPAPPVIKKDFISVFGSFMFERSPLVVSAGNPAP
jgi:hypothetical protein